MTNTITDQHNLVKVETITGGILFWRKVIDYNDGFLRVIFRDGRYHGSILTPHDIARAHNGDTLYTINASSISLNLKGTIRTKDGFIPSYETTLLIRIINPVPFAICYIQSNDPLGMVVTMVQNAITREANHSLHKELKADNLEQVIISSTLNAKTELGVEVQRADRIVLHNDPKWSIIDEHLEEISLYIELRSYDYNEIHPGKDHALNEIDQNVPPLLLPAPINQYLGEKEHDGLQFTAFYQEIAFVDKWQTLLVYAHIEKDLDAIRQDSEHYDDLSEREPTLVSSSVIQGIAHGTSLTIIPSLNSISFSPTSISFTWTGQWQGFIFHFLPSSELAVKAVNLKISVLIGPLLIAELNLPLIVKKNEQIAKQTKTEIRGYLYRRIFASHSHKDKAIVLLLQKAFACIGDSYFIDVNFLRSGENFDEKIKEAIEVSNIFQLFWSKHSAKSDYVRREWMHALICNKGDGFIRPIYWRHPPVPLPTELTSLHLAFYELPQRRWW
jgi:TIR domain